MQNEVSSNNIYAICQSENSVFYIKLLKHWSQNQLLRPIDSPNKRLVSSFSKTVTCSTSRQEKTREHKWRQVKTSEDKWEDKWDYTHVPPLEGQGVSDVDDTCDALGDVCDAGQLGVYKSHKLLNGNLSTCEERQELGPPHWCRTGADWIITQPEWRPPEEFQ